MSFFHKLAVHGMADPLCPVPAAVVLFRPDPIVLARQFGALDHQSRTIYVYVNGPVDPSVEKLLAELTTSRILRSPTNVGQGEALNALADAAWADGNEVLVFFDQDSEPEAALPDQLASDLRLQAGSRLIAAVGPLLVPPAGEGFRPLRYHWLNEARGEALFLPTSGCLVSLQAIKVIGPFRADYFIGGIDVEWGLRAHAAGYRCLVLPGREMVHRWGTPAMGQAGRKPQILRHSPLRNYLYLRNSAHLLSRVPAPATWRLGQCLRLGGQVVRLLLAGGETLSSLNLVVRALADGLAGRLGPPPDLSRFAEAEARGESNRPS